MHMIKAIIFDWGNVLAKNASDGFIDYCAQVLAVDTEDFKKFFEKISPTFQRGEITEEEFISYVCKDLSIKKPKRHHLWSEALSRAYSPIKGMFSLVRQLRQEGYKTALLSNTEPPTRDFFYKQGYDCFDAVVFSCDVGLLKPERKIYELVLRQLGVKPSEAVYIDDRLDFVDGARGVGMKTILFKNISQLEKKLASFSVSFK